MEIQTTVKYHLTPTNKIVIIQNDNEKCWEDLEKLKLSYGSLDRSLKKKKLNTNLPWPSSSIPRHLPKRRENIQSHRCSQ